MLGTAGDIAPLGRASTPAVATAPCSALPSSPPTDSRIASSRNAACAAGIGSALSCGPSAARRAKSGTMLFCRAAACTGSASICASGSDGAAVCAAPACVARYGIATVTPDCAGAAGVGDPDVAVPCAGLFGGRAGDWFAATAVAAAAGQAAGAVDAAATIVGRAGEEAGIGAWGAAA